MEPLTEPQIHAAIRALDAGDRPHRDTLRTALLMALAWHAAQAEIAALRSRMAQLESALEPLADWAYPWPTRAGDELTPRQVFVMQRDIYRARALLPRPNGAQG